MPEKREAESASHYEAFDPLKHGADAERANAKIREREKVHAPGHESAHGGRTGVTEHVSVD